MNHVNTSTSTTYIHLLKSLFSFQGALCFRDFFSALLFIEVSEELVENLDDFKIVPIFCSSHTISGDAKAESQNTVF